MFPLLRKVMPPWRSLPLILMIHLEEYIFVLHYGRIGFLYSFPNPV